MSAPADRSKRPFRHAALFLSLAFPGAGQYYCGRRGRGLGWALAVLALLGVCLYYAARALSLFLADITTTQFDTFGVERSHLLKLCLLAASWLVATLMAHALCAWDAWRVGTGCDRERSG